MLGTFADKGIPLSLTPLGVFISEHLKINYPREEKKLVEGKNVDQ